MRQSPHAAQALGVSVRRVRLTAFALSAAYAGVAGGLLAITVGFIDPVEFGVSASLRQITFIVVGGMGSVAGSVIGAAVLSALPEALRPVKEYSDIIYTLILLGFLIFLPHGLVTLAARALRDAWRAVDAGARDDRPSRRRRPVGALRRTRRRALRVAARRARRDPRADRPERRRQDDRHQRDHRRRARSSRVACCSTGRRVGPARALISRRGIGRTFQHVEPFGEQSVLDNVLLGVGRHSAVGFLARGAARRRARAARSTPRRAKRSAILERFELLPYRDTPAAELPFGVLKRMDLARALAARPTLLLLDEPTSGMSESEADRAIAAARDSPSRRASRCWWSSTTCA